MEIRAIDICLLIGEVEGVSQHLKKIGELEDLEYIEMMKKKYYKMYFSKRKEEMNKS